MLREKWRFFKIKFVFRLIPPFVDKSQSEEFVLEQLKNRISGKFVWAPPPFQAQTRIKSKRNSTEGIKMREALNEMLSEKIFEVFFHLNNALNLRF